MRLIKVAHHRLARRQYTWFKATDPRIHWLVIGEEHEAGAETAVRGWLHLAGGAPNRRAVL